VRCVRSASTSWPGRDSVPLARVGLGCADEPAAGVPGLAVVSAPPAAGLLGAAVLPGQGVQLAVDVQLAGVEVDLVPGEAERFALAEAEREGDEPAGTVRVLLCRYAEFAGVVGCQDVRVKRGRLRRVHALGRVGCDAAAADGHGEGPGEDAVELGHRRLRPPRGPHGLVELLEVLGGELVQADLRNWGRVHPGADVGAVPDEGPGADLHGRDVLHPVVHPLAQARGPAFQQEAFVAVGDGVTEGLRAFSAGGSIEDLALAFPVGSGAEGEFRPPAAVGLQLGCSAFALRAAGRSHLLLSQVRNSGDPQLRDVLAQGR
jgi:hypothetical protein